jgi:site-specific recombinase XerD
MVIKRVMADADISGGHACPKGLRHAFGIAAIQRGIPLNLIQKWLGHSKIETTAIYTNAMGAEERLIAERMWTSLASLTT